MMDKLIEYLKEYEALCQKYDIEISSCGCCNSPYLTEKFEEVEVENIDFDRKTKKLKFSIKYGDYDYYYNKLIRTNIDIETLEKIKDEVRWIEEN